MTKKRGYGAGELRIGKFLVLNEDIYGLAWIAQLDYNSMIDPYFDILTGKLKLQALHAEEVVEEEEFMESNLEAATMRRRQGTVNIFKRGGQQLDNIAFAINQD